MQADAKKMLFTYTDVLSFCSDGEIVARKPVPSLAFW